MDEGAKDSLLWIEEHLPERFELLLRTNREYDKRSGVHGGMWYLHLVECIKQENSDWFSYKSWYSECSDDLYKLLDDVVIIIKHNPQIALAVDCAVEFAEAIRKMVINNEMLVNVMKKAGKECML